jgi:hypothetical protein
VQGLEHLDRAGYASVAGSFWFAVVAHCGWVAIVRADSLTGEFGAVFLLEAAT